MSPIIQQVHSPSKSILSMFVTELIGVLQLLKAHEVSDVIAIHVAVSL